MNEELERLTATWKKYPGASLHVIRAREIALGFTFPADYVDFMLASNGAYGHDDEQGDVYIYPIEEMAPDDECIDPLLSDLYEFGRDGGGEWFCFDVRGAQVRIIMVGDSINDDEMYWQGDTFTEFVRNVPLFGPRRREPANK